jgi:hypothetical protein
MVDGVPRPTATLRMPSAPVGEANPGHDLNRLGTSLRPPPGWCVFQKMIPFVGLLRFTVCETDNHIPENG